MNKSIIDVNGSVLAISQFTLSWRGTKGNRPSFDHSMPPKEASELFNKMVLMLKNDVPVETGEFGASMNVSIEILLYYFFFRFLSNVFGSDLIFLIIR